MNYVTFLSEDEMQYEVRWIIDIEANSPKDAAKEALEIQRDNGSEAIYFTVTEQVTGNKVDIDLRKDKDE